LLLTLLLIRVSFAAIPQVLMEFKEYASEVDVEFVRKSVLAIGRCAIKLDKAAQKCVHIDRSFLVLKLAAAFVVFHRCLEVLRELIKTKVNYVVQEAIIVIKVTICRRCDDRSFEFCSVR
jgi:AP-1 complex subunit beta-1